MSTPAREVTRLYVEALRADAQLAQPNVPRGLLFPDWAPHLDLLDTRVYAASARLPDAAHSDPRLPKVFVDARGVPFGFEQREGDLAAGQVTFWLHATCPEDQEGLCEEIMARARLVVLSTPPRSSRMLAATPVPEGGTVFVRESAADAIRLIDGPWRLRIVGVTA